MTARPEIVRKIAKLLLEKSPKERQELLKLSQLLELLYRLYRSEKDFRGFVLNPTIPKEKKLEFLRSLRERLGIDQRVDEVLDYLLEVNAVPILGEVRRVYDYEVEKLLRLSKALLVLARRVNEQELERIKEVIREFTGRDYEFEVVEDPELIGGFLLKTSSFVLDASVKRGLEGILRG
ncbi:MAG: FoF1 ATP synthase subunit delta [Aquificaceae bacterium]|jgi:F-type H+-transporting ATPase subunit delta|uniref:F0F1 ATP synthase subunit delta n=1 Tax=Hydrogenobacter sp. Uz 6-8 TaxID=3384828 RepID=UPI0030B169FD